MAQIKLTKIISSHQLDNGEAEVGIGMVDEDRIVVYRKANRGSVLNIIDKYEWLDDDGRSELFAMDMEHAKEVLSRILAGKPYSASYLFYDTAKSRISEERPKSEAEHRFTSTGIKFWRHQESMLSYRDKTGNSVICTHISPEGACNLKCPYCSVSYRDTHSRIEIPVIQDYVEKLQSRGLKAVILTGGGEPTTYKQFNELVQWLKYDRKLDVALITNGTMAHKVEEKSWKAFSWVRVSINQFNGWEEKIIIPHAILDPNCVVGASMVYTVEHEATNEVLLNRTEQFKKVSALADRLGAKYIRLLPNCLLPQEQLLLQHQSLGHTLAEVGDPRYFHQFKVHGAPKSSVCHQSYFRPYLSEEPYHEDKKPGTVYPCDSVVLNEGYQKFAKKYQICRAADILEFMDRRKEMTFNPREDCKGCVFTQNVNQLEDWSNDSLDRFSEFSTPLDHENFV